MVAKSLKLEIPTLSALLGMAPVAPDWTGVGAVWPFFERMRAEGAVVLLKLDGGRGPNDAPPYTLMITGTPLGEDYIRGDTDDLDEGLAKIIVEYAIRTWGYRPSTGDA